MQNLEEKVKPIFDLVLLELESAYKNHPIWPGNHVTGAAIILEEAGELIQSVLDVYWHGLIEEKSNMVDEAIQTAAMVVRFLIELDNTKTK